MTSEAINGLRPLEGGGPHFDFWHADYRGGALAEFDCDGFRMLALRAFECAQIMTRRALRFDTSEPHLYPAFRAVGPVNRLLRWR